MATVTVEEKWCSDQQQRILAAESQLAERDAQIAEMRKVIKTVRGDLWAQRERRLREYVTHKTGCHHWWCATCKRHFTGGSCRACGTPTREACTCKLAELLAAQEGV